MTSATTAHPASTSGPSALIATPMTILVISSGSFQRRPYQRQKAITPIIVTALTNASSDTSQVIGMLKPKNTVWNALLAPHQIGVENLLIADDRNRQHRQQRHQQDHGLPVARCERRPLDVIAFLREPAPAERCGGRRDRSPVQTPCRRPRRRSPDASPPSGPRCRR